MARQTLACVGNQSITARVSGAKRVHDKGAKGERDRAVILHSYYAMCREFRVPRDERLTAREVASMTTSQLYQASKDLYNNSSLRDAQRLARKLGVDKTAPTTLLGRARVALVGLARGILCRLLRPLLRGGRQ